MNAGTNQALWISEDAVPDAWTAQFLGTDFKRMPLPEIKPDISKAYLTAKAPVLDVRGSQVELAQDSIGDRRAFRLHVSTPDGVLGVAGSISATSPIAAISFVFVCLSLVRTPARDSGLPWIGRPRRGRASG